jgi:hypothetical protein
MRAFKKIWIRDIAINLARDFVEHEDKEGDIEEYTNEKEVLDGFAVYLDWRTSGAMK